MWNWPGRRDTRERARHRRGAAKRVILPWGWGQGESSTEALDRGRAPIAGAPIAYRAGLGPPLRGGSVDRESEYRGAWQWRAKARPMRCAGGIIPWPT